MTSNYKLVLEQNQAEIKLTHDSVERVHVNENMLCINEKDKGSLPIRLAPMNIDALLSKPQSSHVTC